MFTFFSGKLSLQTSAHSSNEEQVGRCLIYSHVPNMHGQTRADSTSGTCLCTDARRARTSQRSHVFFSTSHTVISNFYFQFSHATRDPLRSTRGRVEHYPPNNGHFMLCFLLRKTNCCVFRSSEINRPPGPFHQSPSFHPPCYCAAPLPGKNQSTTERIYG